MWNRIKPINNGLNRDPNLPPKNCGVYGWDSKDKECVITHLGQDGIFKYEDISFGEFMGWENYEDGRITHWQEIPELPGEPFNHIEGECAAKECVSFCPSLEKE